MSPSPLRPPPAGAVQPVSMRRGEAEILGCAPLPLWGRGESKNKRKIIPTTTPTAKGIKAEKVAVALALGHRWDTPPQKQITGGRVVSATAWVSAVPAFVSSLIVAVWVTAAALPPHTNLLHAWGVPRPPAWATAPTHPRQAPGRESLVYFHPPPVRAAASGPASPHPAAGRSRGPGTTPPPPRVTSYGGPRQA